MFFFGFFFWVEVLGEGLEVFDTCLMGGFCVMDLTGKTFNWQDYDFFSILSCCCPELKSLVYWWFLNSN